MDYAVVVGPFLRAIDIDRYVLLTSFTICTYHSRFLAVH